MKRFYSENVLDLRQTSKFCSRNDFIDFSRDPKNHEKKMHLKMIELGQKFGHIVVILV